MTDLECAMLRELFSTCQARKLAGSDAEAMPHHRHGNERRDSCEYDFRDDDRKETARCPWRNVWGIILSRETNQRFAAEHGQMGDKPFLHLIQEISGPHFHEIIEILAPFPLHLRYGTAFFKIFTNTAVAEDDING
jgi:hypothetical protein